MTAGKTILHEGDELVLSGHASDHIEGVNLYEKIVEGSDEINGMKIADISPSEKLIIMIRRDDHIIIPRGNTRLKENDVLVINEPDD